MPIGEKAKPCDRAVRDEVLTPETFSQALPGGRTELGKPCFCNFPDVQHAYWLKIETVRPGSLGWVVRGYKDRELPWVSTLSEILGNCCAWEGCFCLFVDARLTYWLEIEAVRPGSLGGAAAQI
jgi:hypothetical protein